MGWHCRMNRMLYVLYRHAPERLWLWWVATWVPVYVRRMGHWLWPIDSQSGMLSRHRHNSTHRVPMTCYERSWSMTNSRYTHVANYMRSRRHRYLGHVTATPGHGWGQRCHRVSVKCIYLDQKQHQEGLDQGKRGSHNTLSNIKTIRCTILRHSKKLFSYENQILCGNSVKKLPIFFLSKLTATRAIG